MIKHLSTLLFMLAAGSGNLTHPDSRNLRAYIRQPPCSIL